MSVSFRSHSCSQAPFHILSLGISSHLTPLCHPHIFRSNNVTWQPYRNRSACQQLRSCHSYRKHYNFRNATHNHPCPPWDRHPPQGRPNHQSYQHYWYSSRRHMGLHDLPRVFYHQPDVNAAHSRLLEQDYPKSG